MSKDIHGKVNTYCQKLANVYLRRGNVKVRQIGGEPVAYCVMKSNTIALNNEQIDKYSGNDPDKALMLSLALNYHEIQHLEYTRMPRQILNQARRLKEIHNVLEDGRIETLAVRRFSRLADYFHHAVSTILLNDPQLLSSQDRASNLVTYMLVYGRRLFMAGNPMLSTLYDLNVELVGQDIVSEIEFLVDEYLVSTTQTQRGILVEKVAKILEGLNQNMAVRNPYGHDQITELSPKPDTDADKDGIDRDSLKSDLEKAGKDAKKSKGKLGSADIKEIAKDYEKKEKALDGMRKAQAERENLRNKNLTAGEHMKETDRLSKSESGALKEYQDAQSKLESKGKEIAKKLADELKDISDACVRNEAEKLKEISQTISDENYADLSTFCVDEQAQAQASKIVKNLNKLSIELSEANVKRQSAGRLNIRSFMNRKDSTDLKIFDKFIPARFNRSKMLVNIFMDASGSMGYVEGNGETRWDNVKKSTWVLSNSLERHMNQVMCIGYSNPKDIDMFKEYGRPLKMPKYFKGNTYPDTAMQSNLDFIEEYRRKNGFKVVMTVVVTDGEFNDEYNMMNALDRYNRAGHETVLVKVGTFNNMRDYDFKHKIFMDSFDSLADEVIKVFIKIKRSLNRQVIA